MKEIILNKKFIEKSLRYDTERVLLENRNNRGQFLHSFSGIFLRFSFMAHRCNADIVEVMQIYLRGLYEEGPDNDFYAIVNDLPEHANLPRTAGVNATFMQFFRTNKQVVYGTAEIARMLASLEASYIMWQFILSGFKSPNLFTENRKGQVVFRKTPKLGTCGRMRLFDADKLPSKKDDINLANEFLTFLKDYRFIPDGNRKHQLEQLVSEYLNKYCMERSAA